MPRPMAAGDVAPNARAQIVTGCFFLVERRFWETLRGFGPLSFVYSERRTCAFARPLGSNTRIARIVHYGGASERYRPSSLSM
jgi:hypothetical protein